MGDWEASQTNACSQAIIIFENDLRINLREKINLISVSYLLDSIFPPERSKTSVGTYVSLGLTDAIAFVPYQYPTLSFISNIVEYSQYSAHKYFLV